MAVLATGCGQAADPVVADPATTDPVTSAPTSTGDETGDPVAQQWAARQVYPSCGELTLSMDDELKDVGSAEIGCMRRAFEAGEGAELSVTEPTYEGDPIRVHYRLTPEGGLELYEDSTDDQWSDGSWTFVECYRPWWLPDIACG